MFYLFIDEEGLGFYLHGASEDNSCYPLVREQLQKVGTPYKVIEGNLVENFLGWPEMEDDDDYDPEYGEYDDDEEDGMIYTDDDDFFENTPY